MGAIRAAAIGISLGLAATALLFRSAHSQPAAEPDPVVEEDTDPSLAGPFISDPRVLAELDRVSPDGDCGRSGPLVFGCLIQTLATAEAREQPIGALANPFNLRVASEIRATIKSDLVSFQSQSGVKPEQQLQPAFLTHPASRIELVGIVNRADRQFITDPVPGVPDRDRCGDISLIYRFSYSLRFGEATAASRLPVTMNVVLPGVPQARSDGPTDCAEVSRRWVREMERGAGRTPEQMLADLRNPADGILAHLDGRDIKRIELNLQAYRISAGADQTDLGSTAEYVIRVFRWVPEQDRFVVSYLNNQPDRARLLGDLDGDANSCDPGVQRRISRAELLTHLTRPEVLSDIDTGTLNIPLRFLACRATSVSPGGAHRSGNAPFWSGRTEAERIFTDADITDALRRAENPLRRFSFIRNAGDFRLRLNELTCTGCHQARAIAGFHFPGADRRDTPVSNAVYLPGSPHFYGDQARRREVLRRIASGTDLSRHELAWSYGSRPLNRFRAELANTQLLGGWGGACLTPQAMAGSRRQWSCQPGLECAPLFDSPNSPGLGTCVPSSSRQIGDPMQAGRVRTSGFGRDSYLRVTPAPVGDWTDRKLRNTLIPESLFPANPPAGNSYYAAHQEFYVGDSTGGTGTPQQRARVMRDALTGGFPSGMLRLSECRGLPGEATCGLVASSGFNDCLAQVTKGRRSLADCFAQRTSYAGMRACSSSSPCRDDYICLRPIGYNAANGQDRFDRRQSTVSGIYNPNVDFGQLAPDQAWLGRNGGRGDQRGICIPPYFVFQFRSDGHPNPPAP
jgi:hypothetical protein